MGPVDCGPNCQSKVSDQVARDDLPWIHLGGQVRPFIGKVQIWQAWPPHMTNQQVHQSLGLAGYYNQFILQFASIAVLYQTPY